MTMTLAAQIVFTGTAGPLFGAYLSRTIFKHDDFGMKFLVLVQAIGLTAAATYLWGSP